MNIKDRNDNMKAFFDRKADGYDDVHAAFLDTKNAMIQYLSDCTKSVLDLGAGTGLELRALFERFPDVEVTAIDISEQMLDILNAHFPNVKTIAGDFFNTDFGSGYDAVISTSALHHWDEENKLKMYKMVFDSLNNAGTFVNSDKIAETQAEQDEWLGYWNNSPEMMAHIDTPLTPENEVKLLKAAGFASVTVYPAPKDDYRVIVAVK